MEKRVRSEVFVLRSLVAHDKGVISLHDVLEGELHYFLIMELLDGGNVFDRVMKKDMYSEMEARQLAKNLLTAVEYIHSRLVTHRDLKPQNLLFATSNNDTDIKVAGFSFATIVQSPKSLRTRCGTPTYVAPEILKGSPYDQAVDMWSVGVILFVTLVGYPPFMEQDKNVQSDKICRGEYEFLEEDWGGISKVAQNLINSLLVVNPDYRWSASQALRHEWFIGDSRNDVFGTF